MMVDTIKYEVRYYVHESDEDPFEYHYYEILADATSEAVSKAEDYSKQYSVTEILFREVGITQATVTFESN
jgi:hypothetical protein